MNFILSEEQSAFRELAKNYYPMLATHHLDHNTEHKTLYSAMAKRFATDTCFKICNEAIQIHGGYGCMHDFPLERNMRDARIHQIIEGTNEIMRLIIADRFLKTDPSETIR